MTTMTTQLAIPTLSLPAESVKQTKQRTRTRSGSLLKVEEVGEGSAEQDLDQNLYVNINADWVNMKGEHDPPFTVSPELTSFFPFPRRLARSPPTRLLRKDCGRHCSRNEPRN